MSVRRRLVFLGRVFADGTARRRDRRFAPRGEGLEPRELLSTVRVIARSNIFGAGRAHPPAPGGGGGGVLPVRVDLADLDNPASVVFPSVAGQVSGWAAAGGFNGPDGGRSWGGVTNVRSWNGIAGIRHQRATMFLVGVFLGPEGQPAAAPPRLNATGANSLAGFAPMLGQQFFIGDGRTNLGALQTFKPPAGAAALYLGFAESFGFGNPDTPPGYYGDNGGALTVDVQPISDIALISSRFVSATGRVDFTYQTEHDTGPFTVGLFQSQDLNLDAADTLLATRTVTAAARSTGAGSFDLGFTPAVTADRPYLLVVADPPDFSTGQTTRGQIPETDELNNTAPVRYREFDRDAFLQLYQDSFGEKLSPARADGLNTVLSLVELDRFMDDPRWIAYLLATTKHETGNGAQSWRPADEGVLASGKKVAISYFNIYEPGTRQGRILGNTQKGDGYRFRGRGYVQLTGRDNYARLGQILGYPLVDEPDRVFNPVVAYNAMSHGMRFGFGRRDRITKRPQTLERFERGDGFDYFAAREIINGDKDSPFDRKRPGGPTIGQMIAGYATRFELIIQATITRFD